MLRQSKAITTTLATVTLIPGGLAIGSSSNEEAIAASSQTEDRQILAVPEAMLEQILFEAGE